MKDNNNIITFKYSVMLDPAGEGVVTCNRCHIYVYKYNDSKFGLSYKASVLYDKYNIDEDTYLDILKKLSN